MASKKQPASKKKEASRKNKTVVRLSDEDHALLSKLAEQTGRKLMAENHQALLAHFRKHGMLPPDTAT